MGIENFSLVPAEDPLQKEAEAIARASGQDPDKEPDPKQEDVELHARLMDWRNTEKERSQLGRDEMSIDADFRDGLQWSAEDARILRERGQDPVAFNRILPQVEWMVGTERRTRVDAKVLPRTKNDTEGARAQSDVLKYLHDVNNERFHVSRAFDDSVTVGLGWMEDYVNPDPTKEAIASRYESWRYVWYDSASYEFDLSDARYIFRERWTDLDLAIAMLPEAAAHLRFVAEGYDPEKERNEYFMGMNLQEWEPAQFGRSYSGFVYTSGGGVIRFGGRQRVRLIEWQYRRPKRVQVFVGGPLHGQIYDKQDPQHRGLVERGEAGLFKTYRLVTHLALGTERGLIFDRPSVYRHDSFTLTPVWGYRRARDNMPYGIVRNLRGIQEDLNKRFARSLYRLSSQQVIADEDATTDWVEFKEQAFDPNGILRKKRGSEVAFRQDYQTAEGDMKLMQQELVLLQDAGGPTAENMGMETNAQSGRAVLARQQQGAITMERMFDNLRLAHQLRGQKKLSMVRQFMTEPQVLRLTDSRGRAEWLEVNQLDEVTGLVKNDIVTTQADFIVSEQDFRASSRMAMFDTLMEMLSRQPPEIAIQLLDLALEVGDLPNQEEIVKRVRKINGQPDPDAQDDPAEIAKQKEAEQAAAAAAELQQRAVVAQVAESENKARKLAAEAAEIEARIGLDPANGELAGDMRTLMDRLRQAEETIALQKVQLANKGEEIALRREELANRTEAEREKANAAVITSENDKEIAREQSNATLASGGEEVEASLEEVTKQLAELKAKLEKSEEARLKEREKAVERREKESEAKPQAPIVVQVAEPKPKKARKRRVTLKKQPDGSIVADVDESD